VKNPAGFSLYGWRILGASSTVESLIEALRSCGIYPIRGTYLCKAKTGERWELLCKLAAEEQNPDKLLELAAAIERLLIEKEERLRKTLGEKQGAAQGCSAIEGLIAKPSETAPRLPKPGFLSLALARSISLNASKAE
jgi:hypothetical protein